MMRVTLQLAITMDVIMTVISKIFFIVLLFFNFECKDKARFILVFHFQCEFYHKIVFFSFFGFIKEPNNDRLYSLGCDSMLFSNLFPRLMGVEASVTGNEVVIDYGLVAYFEFVSFLRHAEVVRVSYQVRDIV